MRPFKLHVVYYVSYDIWISTFVLAFSHCFLFFTLYWKARRGDSYLLEVNKVRIGVFFEKDRASRNFWVLTPMPLTQWLMPVSVTPWTCCVVTSSSNRWRDYYCRVRATYSPNPSRIRLRSGISGRHNHDHASHPPRFRNVLRRRSIGFIIDDVTQHHHVESTYIQPCVCVV